MKDTFEMVVLFEFNDTAELCFADAFRAISLKYSSGLWS